jgi:hypothetical protein
MAKPSRPSLTSLSAQVGSVSREAISAPEPQAARKRLTDTPAGSTTEERGAVQPPKLIHVGVNGPGWLEMSRLAQDLGTSVEDLMVASFNDALVKHGRPPVVERQETIREAAPDSAKASYPLPSPLIWPGFAGAWWWYQAVAAPALKAWSTDVSAPQK